MTATSEPSGIPEEEVRAYLDGAPNAQLDALRKRSPEFDRRVRTHRYAAHHLRASLYRFDCPNPDELRDYHFQLLGPDRTHAIAHHLTECASCRHELEAYSVSFALQVPLTDVDHEKLSFSEFVDQIKQGIGVFFATLINPSLSSELQLGGALRGDALRQNLYRVPDHDDWLIVVSSQQDATNYSLSVELSAPDIDNFAAINATLLAKGVFIAELSLDEVGGTTFNGLDSGTYDLWLDMQSARLAVIDVQVG